jgi:hypothetical protein
VSARLPSVALTLCALLFASFASVASGCAHTITVESTPPGALVLVEDKPVGKTPITFEEQTGRADLVVVEVQHGERSARFAYKKEGVSLDAVAGAVAGSCGMCAAGGFGLAGLVVLVPTLLVTAATPAGISLLIGAYVAYAFGISMISYAPYALVMGVGEGARKGPERIHVDFARAPAALVTTVPDDMTVPLVGRRAKPARAPPHQRF